MAGEPAADPNRNANLEPRGDGTTIRQEAAPSSQPAGPGAGEPEAAGGKGKPTGSEPTGSGTLLGGGEGAAAQVKPWMSALPKDLKDNPVTVKALSAFESQNDVIRAFLQGSGATNLQELIQAASEEDRAKYWKLRGRPESADKYALDFSALPKDLAPNDTFAKAFRDKAFQLGLNQAEVTEFLGMYNQQSLGMFNQLRNSYVKAGREAETELRSQWHGEYEGNLEKAKRAALRFGGATLIKFLNESRLGDHPEMIRAWYNVGEATSEDSLASAQSTPAPARTPGQFQYPSMEGETGS